MKRLFAKRSQRKKGFKVVADSPLNAALVLHNSSHKDSRLEENAGSCFRDYDFGAIGHFVQQADQINFVFCEWRENKYSARDFKL